ncbi:MAG TPA: nucleotidyl transferase AbiEii/AbiGii toxin family protein [Phycisphaerae bacterium]|jgi:hypothetical protein
MHATINAAEIPYVRQWRGARLSPVEEMLMFHKDAGPVPDTLSRLQAALEKEGIDYVVIGALAMGVHHARRATEDVDLCLRPADLKRFRDKLVGSVYQAVEGRSRRFYDPQTQVTFDLLVSGEIAGHRGRNKTIRFPDPAEAVEIAGLRTVSLEQLIALKLVTWRLQDWADVVRLIRENKLIEEFSQRLPKEIHAAYLQCHDQMLEEQRYDEEHGGT